MPATPRSRARLLGRSGRAQPALFAPLVLAQAAEIEALSLDAFLTDATRLTKGLTALHQALGTDAVTTAGADGLLAEAAGAELDWSSYPPAVVSHPAENGSLPADIAERAAGHGRVEAAVEATARLSATAPGEPLVVTAFTGPATLAAQLGGDGFGALVAGGGPALASFLETIGQLTLGVLQRFLEAGAHLVVLVEDAPPPATLADEWRSAVVPLVNVARFHQAVPVVVVAGETSTEACATIPPSVGVCLPDGVAVSGPPNRIRGLALPAAPKEWKEPPAGTPLVVTAGAVPGRFGFAEVLEACRRMMNVRAT